MSAHELIERRNAVVSEAQEIVKGLNGQSPEEETAEKLRSLDDEFKSLEEQIASAKDTDEMVARLSAAKIEEAKIRDEARPPMYGEPGEFNPMTPGEAFIRSEQYQAWLSKYPAGGPSVQVEAFSGSVGVGEYRDLLGLRTATDRLKARSLVTSATGSGGDWVYSLRRGMIEPGLTRPLTVRDLVTVLPVTTDTVEYVKEVSRLANAATVAEATALTGTSGTKPEGGLTFLTVVDTVKTIAEWVPVTRRIMSDASALRGYIDQYLADDLALELEDQMVAGNGSGENFTGILNNSDVQTQTSSDNQLDDIRAAIRKVKTVARTNPTAVLLNPEDLEAIDTLRAQNVGATYGAMTYLGADPYNWSPNRTMWGLPIVESEAVSQGTAIVGDFRKAVLFDREQTNISVGTAGDDFIRNIMRILAELRAGFGIIRPKAFCVITF